MKEKIDKEFYEDLDLAFNRWKEIKDKCRNCHLIKAISSKYYVVYWEK